ncbi:TrlF family AAA-like ATPase [Streptomyces sp. NPDC001351]|uniref:TrlF family AAA-like ATPase n=1 Tax=Streptomyces sp. NPDC001351 TaxID=3364564 RepID=UPI0036B7EE09
MVITASRWYKCDLQVATPAHEFRLPAGSSFDFSSPEDRADFADRYMTRLREQGIEVIALADHNTGDWLPDMQAAGDRHGVVVFPGVEVTTASGADGAHLILIGDLDRTARDIDTLLAQTCGFNDDHPRFNPATNQPASAGRTLCQILDDLPDQWLAIAPHALTDNGIASEKTLKGDLRWKALHHDRLGAIDPGNVQPERLRSGSWNARFLSRALDHLPCLSRLPFVATSDAYCLEDLGRRFTWIRMDQPSKEALRQAFLDHEARIIPSWDARLTANPDPNVVDHAWVERVNLGGTLGNSATPLDVSFDPRLNVVIGGRGSGKSTLVAALRQLYGRLDGLPPGIEQEARAFVEGVFSAAELSADHRIAISREQHTARWTFSSGSQTPLADRPLPTRFPMRIFSQKELFERTAHDRHDRFAASRHLFSLVDDALKANADSPDAYETELESALTNCLTSVAERLNAESRLSQRPALEARHTELSKQVAAFGDTESQGKRHASEAVVREHAQLAATTSRFHQALDELLASAAKHLRSALPTSSPPPTEAVAPFYAELEQIRTQLENHLQAIVTEAIHVLDGARANQQRGEWASTVAAAEQEILDFQERMNHLGIDPTGYLTLTEALNGVSENLRALEGTARVLNGLREDEESAWAELRNVHERRRRRRERLLLEVEHRSGSLRFEITPYGNASGWCIEVRELLGIRSDGYVEDVPALATWLWEGPSDSQSDRLALWRCSVLNGAFGEIKQLVSCKAGWWNKLTKLEPTQRIRLAMICPDDVVIMYFLRDGGKRESSRDWQPVTTGSPGQRSAAMLSFVLHHGAEPLVLDQPEDDLDTAWISQLIVPEIRKSRWKRQVIVITHNANIPVNADAERVIVLDNDGTSIRVKTSTEQKTVGALQEVEHSGPIEVTRVRRDIQDILEGGTEAFMSRERRYNNELNTYRAALRG